MSTILSHLEGGVLTLTLNRPEALNALNLAMIADLKAATAKAELDDGVGVVVIQGGEHFMAGGDLKWFHSQLVLPPEERPDAFSRMWAAIEGARGSVLGGLVYVWTTDGPERVDMAFGLVDGRNQPVDDLYAAVGATYRDTAGR